MHRFKPEFLTPNINLVFKFPRIRRRDGLTPVCFRGTVGELVFAHVHNAGGSVLADPSQRPPRAQASSAEAGNYNNAGALLQHCWRSG